MDINKLKTHGNAVIEVDLRGSNPSTPNYPKNHVKKILPVYRGTNFTKNLDKFTTVL
eukprot:SAG11_NODE_2533_length_3246_cov_40.379409_2_plen_57_part_00